MQLVHGPSRAYSSYKPVISTRKAFPTAPWQNILNSNYVHTYNTLFRGGFV